MERTGKIWNQFLLVAGMVLLYQCSPSGKSLLTFLFDGVPDHDDAEAVFPGSEADFKDSTGLALEDTVFVSQSLFIHAPYGERECIACHDENSLGTMVELQPGLCYICHEDLSTQFQYLHGPVAGGYCTSCHNPHMSEQQKLLRFSGDQLCFYCHKSESVFRNAMHEGLEGMACTDCHNPHGGEDRYIFQ